MTITVLSDNQADEQSEINQTEIISNLSPINSDKLYMNEQQSNKNKQKIAFYAGSFDPFTNGHWALVCEAMTKCDKVYIGIGINPDKEGFFTPTERIEGIKKTIYDFVTYYTQYPHHLSQLNKAERIAYQRLYTNPNAVEVLSYEGLTIDTALKLKATVLVRGVRNENDTMYEDSLNKINQILLEVRGQKLDNLILRPENQAEIKHISSSTVKSLCQVNEYIALQGFVSPAIHNQLCEKQLKSIFQQTVMYFGITDSNKIDSEYKTLIKYGNNSFITSSYIGFLINYINIQDTLKGPIKNDIKHLLRLSAFYRGEQKKGTSNKEIEERLQRFIGGDISPIMALINVKESDKECNQLTAIQYLILESERKLTTYSQQYPQYIYHLNDKSSQATKIKSGISKIFGKQNDIVKQYD